MYSQQDLQAVTHWQKPGSHPLTRLPVLPQISDGRYLGLGQSVCSHTCWYPGKPKPFRQRLHFETTGMNVASGRLCHALRSDA